MSLRSEKGIVLISAFMLIIVVLIYLTAFVAQAIWDRKILQRDKYATEANYISQAGLEKAFYDLDIDYRESNNWTDGDINGIAVSAPDCNNPDNYYALYTDEALGEGTYSTQIKYVCEGLTPRNDRIWVKSTAEITGTDTQFSLEQLVKAKIVKNINLSKLYDTVNLAEPEATGGDELRIANGTVQEGANLTLSKNLTIAGSYNFDFAQRYSDIQSTLDLGAGNTLTILSGITVTMGGLRIE